MCKDWISKGRNPTIISHQRDIWYEHIKILLILKSYSHNTNDCIQLKDAIKESIKRGRLTEYVKGGKRDREESPRGKSPKGYRNWDMWGEQRGQQRKYPYIFAIIGGTSGESPFQRDDERKNMEMMAIYHKEGNTYAKNLDHHMLGFRDLKKIRGIWMEIYPLVIITKTRKFYVSQILIDGDISCDILYSEFFQNMNLDRHTKAYTSKCSTRLQPVLGDMWN